MPKTTHMASAEDAFNKLGFKPESIIGHGRSGKLYRGTLKHNEEMVVVKQLGEGDALQGNRDFLLQVLILSLVQHDNIVSLIGYCTDGGYRLLVYEYVPFGSLQEQLFGSMPSTKTMDWNMRMKIAAGIAKGLEHLHTRSDPPLIHGNLRPSKVLMDENMCPKLYDIGLTKSRKNNKNKKKKKDNTNETIDILHREYMAPEAVSNGTITSDSDVYSFGVIILELITGRKAFDGSLPSPQQFLVKWAKPLFKDRRMLAKLADPELRDNYPKMGLHQAIAVAAMCLQEKPATRPSIEAVVAALNHSSLLTEF